MNSGGRGSRVKPPRPQRLLESYETIRVATRPTTKLYIGPRRTSMDIH